MVYVPKGFTTDPYFNAIGSKAPDFKLMDAVDNKFKSSIDLFKNKGILIMFICNHCPFVVHVIDEIIKIGLAKIKKINEKTLSITIFKSKFGP